MADRNEHSERGTAQSKSVAVSANKLGEERPSTPTLGSPQLQQPTNSPQPTHFLQTPGLPQSTHSSQPAELPQSTHSSQHTKLPQPIHSPQPADLPQPTHSPQHSEFRQSNEFPQGDWADLPEVAFLELADGRLQGVIPSETTPSRVYASSITAGDHGLSCRSNDDLPAAGWASAPPVGTSRHSWRRR